MTGPLMLVALLSAGFTVAWIERRAARRALVRGIVAGIESQFAELARVIGEQLTPAVRSVAEKMEEFGQALLKNGGTKWK